ncbi:MAG: ferredoxin [Pseudomonadota bacterium]|jgi:ferredoxin
MSYKIVGSQCTGCSACEPVCPNVAIYEKDGIFAINPKKCTECIGYFDEAQCEAVCPVDKTCIIDPAQPRYQPRA